MNVCKINALQIRIQQSWGSIDAVSGYSCIAEKEDAYGSVFFQKKKTIPGGASGDALHRGDDVDCK